MMDRIFAWVNRSWIKTAFHNLFFRNRLVLRLAGFRMPPLQSAESFGSVYGDLTTFLLARKLRALIPGQSARTTHEIGVGPYGTLSVYIRKRFPDVVHSASTIVPDEIFSSREVAAMNSVAYPCIESDVLEKVSGRFDIIWWNLPYYFDDVEACIDRLFRQVHEKGLLGAGGLVLLGFNGVPLKIDRVVAIVARHPFMRLCECQTYLWNPHALVLAEYLGEDRTQAPAPAGAEAAPPPA